MARAWGRAMMSLAIAFASIGCGSGDGDIRIGDDGGVQTSFRCELGVHVDIYVRGEDWEDGRADLSSHAFSQVDPGDTIAFRITFVDPIFVEEGQADPSRFVVTAASAGDSTAGEGIDPSLTFQGTLGLSLSSAHFEGSADEGTLDGFQVDIDADDELSPGEVLSCVTVMMTVPSDFDSGSFTVSPGQDLRFDSILLER